MLSQYLNTFPHIGNAHCRLLWSVKTSLPLYWEICQRIALCPMQGNVRVLEMGGCHISSNPHGKYETCLKKIKFCVTEMGVATCLATLVAFCTASPE